MSRLICRHCGGRVSKRDKHCVYCGKQLRVVPTWAKVAAILGCVVLVCGVSVVLLERGHYQGPPPAEPAPADPVQLPNASVILNGKASGTAVEGPIASVNSRYLAATAPAIDGLLTPGEWPDPAFKMSFDYSVADNIKTGEMAGYFMNDDTSLYVAITASAEDFKEAVFVSEGVSFVVELWLDGDNDGQIMVGHDIKGINRIGNIPTYSDRHLGASAYAVNDGQKDGLGACTYSDQMNTYTYEFQFPLDSGDSEDLAVTPGDTLGLEVILKEVQWSDSTRTSLNAIGKDGWPNSGELDGRTYAKVTLAIGP